MTGNEGLSECDDVPTLPGAGMAFVEVLLEQMPRLERDVQGWSCCQRRHWQSKRTLSHVCLPPAHCVQGPVSLMEPPTMTKWMGDGMDLGEEGEEKW